MSVTWFPLPCGTTTIGNMVVATTQGAQNVAKNTRCQKRLDEIW
jgi:hypothetical protein